MACSDAAKLAVKTARVTESINYGISFAVLDKTTGRVVCTPAWPDRANTSLRSWSVAGGRLSDMVKHDWGADNKPAGNCLLW